MRKAFRLLTLLLTGCGSAVSGPDASTCLTHALQVEEKLRCLPGVLSVTVRDAGVFGYSRLDISLEQPVDHFGDAGTYAQRVTVLHRGFDEPVVLATTGYSLSTRRGEVASLYATNQINYEHRYFGPSRPNDDFRYNQLRQVAADAHRIVETFRPLYSAPWVSTGVSRGGMTAVYHRAHYPLDVAGTVAYVAPECNSPSDARFPVFLSTVGGTAHSSCRLRLVELQRAVLTRRREVLALVDSSLTFARLGRERMLEHAVLEAFFAFWQYRNPSDPVTGCAALPDPQGPASGLHDFIEGQVGWDYFSDATLEFFAGYYHAAAAEEGGPQPAEADLSGLLQYPGTYVVSDYSPVPVAYSREPQREVTEWVAQEGEHLLFIYGEFDPWSAGRYHPSLARDNAVFMVPGGNHSASLSALSTDQKTSATAMLTRWLAKPPVRPLRRADLEEEVAPQRRMPR